MTKLRFLGFNEYKNMVSRIFKTEKGLNNFSIYYEKGAYAFNCKDTNILYEIVFNYYSQNIISPFVELTNKEDIYKPLYIDIDAEFKNDNLFFDNKENCEKLFKLICEVLKEFFNEYLVNIKDFETIKFLYETRGKTVLKSENIRKYGIHLMIYDIITEKSLIEDITEIIKNKFKIAIEKNMPEACFTNDYNEIFDSHYAKNGNWFIFTNSKLCYKDYYRPFNKNIINVFNTSTNEFTTTSIDLTDCNTFVNFCKTCSIRNRKKSNHIFNIIKNIPVINNIITKKQEYKVIDPKNNIIINTNTNNIKFENRIFNIFETNIKQLIIVKNIISMLEYIDPIYADSYTEWFNIMTCCKCNNVPQYYFLQFAKKSPKFNLDENIKKWNSINMEEYNTKYLYNLVKKNNILFSQFKTTAFYCFMNNLNTITDFNLRECLNFIFLDTNVKEKYFRFSGEAQEWFSINHNNVWVSSTTPSEDMQKFINFVITEFTEFVLSIKQVLFNKITKDIEELKTRINNMKNNIFQENVLSNPIDSEIILNDKVTQQIKKDTIAELNNKVKLLKVDKKNNDYTNIVYRFVQKQTEINKIILLIRNMENCFIVPRPNDEIIFWNNTNYFACLNKLFDCSLNEDNNIIGWRNIKPSDMINIKYNTGYDYIEPVTKEEVRKFEEYEAMIMRYIKNVYEVNESKEEYLNKDDMVQYNKDKQDGRNTLDYLLKSFANCFNGNRSYSQLLYIHQGTGSNGKSEIMQSIIDPTFGGYCATFNTSLLINEGSKGDGPTNELDSLKGCRIAYATETQQKINERTGKIKTEQFYLPMVNKLVGGDFMTSRANYKNLCKWKNIGMINLLVNICPHYVDDTHGAARRMKIINYNNTFKTKEEIQNDECYKKDYNIYAKESIKQHINNIYFKNACLRILTKYYLESNKGLDVPNAVYTPECIERRTDKYINKNSIFKEFIKDNFIISKMSEEEAAKVVIRSGLKLSIAYEKYTDYQASRGLEPITNKNFKSELIKLGAIVKKSSEEYYINIQVIELNTDILHNYTS